VYARIAAFEGCGLERLGAFAGDDDARRESLPRDVVLSLVLADEERNRRLFITLFESHDDMQRAALAFDGMADDVPEDERGRRTSVEHFEVLLADTSDDARVARDHTLEVPTDQIDDALRYAGNELLPKMREVPGWQGVLALADRESGRLRFITLWRSADSLAAGDARVADFPETASPELAAAMPDLATLTVLLTRRR